MSCFGNAVERRRLGDIGHIRIPGIGRQLLRVTIRADYVTDVFAIRSHPALVLIRKTVEAEWNRARLNRGRLDSITLGVQAVGVAGTPRAGI